VQNGLHRLFNIKPQRGWPHQVEERTGVMVRYEEVWTFRSALGGRRAPRLTARWGGTAGNVIRGVHVGAVARLERGERLPWSPAEPGVERPRRHYLLAGYRQDLVLHNHFLQGRASSPGTGAERRALVGEGEVGFGTRRNGYSVEFRHVMRGREYEKQRGIHSYGSLVLTVHQR
jgi:hypothetical protein